MLMHGLMVKQQRLCSSMERGVHDERVRHLTFAISTPLNECERCFLRVVVSPRETLPIRGCPQTGLYYLHTV